MGKHSDRVGQVIFAAKQGRLLFGVRPAPVLRQVGAAIRRGRDIDARRHGEWPRRRLETLFLADVIEVQAQALATVIKRDGTDTKVAVLIVDGRVATLQVAVEAHAKLIVRAKATAQIQMTTHLGIRSVSGGDPRQVFIQRTLGHDIDHAADAAVGRDAVHQRPWPLEHFDPFGVVGKHAIVRRYAIHTVECQLAKIAFADREAANEKRIDDTAGLTGGAHRRITLQRIGNGHGLQVSEGLGGVTGDTERRVHHILVAHHAQAGSPCNLATGEGFRQRSRAAVGSVDVSGVERQRVRAVIGRRGGCDVRTRVGGNVLLLGAGGPGAGASCDQNKIQHGGTHGKR